MWEITALGWMKCCSWHLAPATPMGNWVQPAWRPPIPEPPFPGSGTSALRPPSCSPQQPPKSTWVWVWVCSQKPHGPIYAPKNHVDPGTLTPAHLLPPAHAAPAAPTLCPHQAPSPWRFQRGLSLCGELGPSWGDARARITPEPGSCWS